MSAQSVPSVEELSSYFSSQQNACVLHDSATDCAHAVVSCVKTHEAAGQQVCVVCADRWSAARLGLLLQNDEHASVHWVRDIATQILNDSRVIAATGRSGRVLDGNELDVLMEDVKVCGVAPHRLREMMKFFFKSLADCATDDDYWLVNQEEKKVYAIFTENLRIRKAVVPEEASLRACEGLDAVPDASAPSYIVAVDFGAMSKSSQRLLQTISHNTMTVFGCIEAETSPDEDYPFHEGLTLWADQASVETFTIAAPQHSAKQKTISFATPVEEFAGIKDIVDSEQQQGTDANDILIAVPNGIWANKIGKQLDKAGMPHAYLSNDEKVHGDPRHTETCGKIKLAAFAKLQKDPNDLVALRTWIGCGDWLMCSEPFLEVLAYSRDHDDCGLIQALKQMRANPSDTKAFSKINASLDELDALRDDLSQAKTAKDAVEAFARADISLTDKQQTYIDEDASGISLQRLYTHALPKHACVHGTGVQIAPYDVCHALYCKAEIITGMIGGFIPKNDALSDSFTIDHKNKARARDERLYRDLLSRASERVYCTLFDHDRIENAVTLNMRVSRIYVHNKKQMARVVPCQYLAVGGGEGSQK